MSAAPGAHDGLDRYRSGSSAELTMRLPARAHTSQPWRIHEIAPDFRVEDVWALPGRGGPDGISRLVQLLASLDPSRSSSRATRALFALRWRIGELLGWDEAGAGLGSDVPTLRDRLPADLRDRPAGPCFDAMPFTPLYMTEEEFAAEVVNRTVHGVMHIGWLPAEASRFRAQMAVLVKPNGLLGEIYMVSIRPFRYLIVYPALMREAKELWERSGERTQPPVGARSGH